jgi:hypothetical protein
MKCKQLKKVILGHHTIDNSDNSPQFTKKQKQEKASIPPSKPPSATDNPPPLLFEDDFSTIRHPEIKRLVGELKESTTSDRDFVKAAFGWVRDNIKYCVQSDWTVSVEFTLEHREGQCSTKSCLLVALLRAAGLEAAFYIVRPFDVRRQMFPVPHWIRSILSREGVHFFVGVKLDGDWVKLDPSFDRRLCFGLQNACPEPNYLVKFDGFHDALVPGDFYTGLELTPVQNIDVYMRKKHRVPSSVHTCMNVCFDYIRDSSRRNTNVEDLIVEMESHLSNEYNLGKSSLG